MSTTLRDRYDYPNFDDWVSQSPSRDVTTGINHHLAKKGKGAWDLATLLKRTIGVVITAVIFVISAVLMMSVLLLVLPWLMIAPAAIAGFVIMVWSYFVSL